MRDEFKVGDKVKVIKGRGKMLEYEGQTGTVVDCQSNGYTGYLGFEGSSDRIFFVNEETYDNIELIKPFAENKPEKRICGVSGCNNNAKYSGLDDSGGRKYKSRCAGCINRKSQVSNNDGSCPSENKPTKNIMNKISTFVKNSLLSADERLMRKHGLKDEYGEYTNDARELIIAKTIQDNEEYFVTISKNFEAEEKKNKK